MKSLLALAFLVVAANALYYETKPELGKYQDEAECYPYESYWYVIYRTFDHDPYFGDSKCAYVAQTGPLVNGTAHGHHKDSTGAVLSQQELHKAEGYKHYNKQNVTLLGGPKKGHSVSLYTAYSDCYECKVYRHPYAGENACTLLVPAHKKNHLPQSCKFIFHLLCGSTYETVYDETCRTHAFPYERPWFAVLRNFESDPYLGGTAKCIRVTQAAPLQGDVTENVVEFGTQKARNRVTLMSTEGYRHKNALNVTFLEGPAKASHVLLFNVYSDCDKCKMYRNLYAGENACTLFVPEGRRNQIDPTCQFIFNLLCGSENHYRLLDDSCTF
ncbi:hypothetical protein HPB50_022482 [Hyalomma asiaticum]|uniref:Uncharacterized protein n=1 Tax=Hyalomma asiaticum TaxID=266040 RepID=A0ACB7S298_HYAAI|nr:hypothetical protein HPB50_022482 [Hyalomma asiaticum]